MPKKIAPETGQGSHAKKKKAGNPGGKRAAKTPSTKKAGRSKTAPSPAEKAPKRVASKKAGAKAAKRNEKKPSRQPTKRLEANSGGAGDAGHAAKLRGVVGIGASAGGLQAARHFFYAMPADSGLAFVLIQHLDPGHKSHFPELIGKMTKMPVREARQGERLEPNQVYVIPPGKYLDIAEGKLTDGKLRLSVPPEPRHSQMAIDFFLKSLAHAYREKAIGILLSASSNDGVLGLQEIKQQGGLTLVQTPEEADFGTLPRNAIATGVVDKVTPIDEMPELLRAYLEHGEKLSEDSGQEDKQDYITRLLSILHRKSRYDFRKYRRTTLRRRIDRRMSLFQIEQPEEYIDIVQDDPKEMYRLIKDLLICVTSFFRDPEAWAILEKKVIPELIDEAIDKGELRVWVPGCGTGEEPISLAILIAEEIDRRNDPDIRVQIFATDIVDEAIEVGRTSLYPSSIAIDVSEERLNRFFVRENDEYRVATRIRDMLIFARQNLVGDPPFSRLDMIVCRNLLIYLEPELQEEMIGNFQFALRQGGYLFLGSSETLGSEAEGFDIVSKKWRIFQSKYERRLTKTPYYHSSTIPAQDSDRNIGRHVFHKERLRSRSPAELTRSKLIAKYAPASVLTDTTHRVHYLSGPVDDFLRLPEGEPTKDLLSMARHGLRSSLRHAIREAAATEKEFSLEDARVRRDGGWYPVRITVRPVEDPLKSEETYLLVSFEPAERPAAASKRRPSKNRTEGPARDVQHLEAEVREARQEHQTTIDQLQTANEELKASNEEIMSMNKELQASNEELQTSKEEYQSVNEELTTVNVQLEEKVSELVQVSNDLENLLANTTIAMIFLDRDLRIKRFAPAAVELFNFIPADVGRPLADLIGRFKPDNLLNDAKSVLENQAPIERVVQTLDSRWFDRRVLPYRTSDDRIGGVVITLNEVTRMKEAEEQLRASEERFRTLAEAAPVMIWMTDARGNFTYFNKVWLQFTGHSLEHEVESGWDEGIHPDDQEAVAAEFSEALREHRPLKTDHRQRQSDGVYRWLMCQADPLYNPEGVFTGFIGSCVDISDRRGMEVALRESEERLRLAMMAADIGTWRVDIEAGTETRSAAHNRILGLPEEETTQPAGNFLLHVYESDREGVRKLFEDAIHSNGQFRADYRIVRPDGVVRWLRDQGEYFPRDTVDRPILTGAAVDITERKRAEHALEEAARQKDNFLATLAHELRNPLAPIVNALYILKAVNPGDETVKEMREIVDRQVTHMSRLIDDLLDVSRISRGIVDLQSETLDLGGLVRAVLHDYGPESEAAGISVETDIAEGPVWVRGDTTRLAQVVGNLLQNAIKFSEPDDRIHVIVERESPGWARCTIRDEGLGIHPAKLQDIFEAFHQAETSLDRAKGGLGLGLSLVKGLVELHGGEVWARSKGRGSGAEFSFRLPTLENGELPAPGEAGRHVEELGPLRILVVEDHEDGADSLRRMLEMEGHSVRVARTGEEALERAREFAPELVLCDIGLPDINGYEVARRLQGEAATRGAFLVAVSGYGRLDDRQRAAEAGFDEHLTKPVRMNDLQAMFGRAAENRQASEA